MRRIGLAMIVLGLGLGLMGCEKALFSEEHPRTQYDRYDRLRGRWVPTEQTNAFGGTQPNLRARLNPYRLQERRPGAGGAAADKPGVDLQKDERSAPDRADRSSARGVRASSGMHTQECATWR